MDRLVGEFRVRAGRAQVQKLADAGPARGFDGVECNCRVVVKELRRIRGIGADAADMRGGDDHRIGAVLCEPRFGVGLAGQVEVGMRDRQHLAALAAQPRAQRCTDQPGVPGDINALP